MNMKSVVRGERRQTSEHHEQCCFEKESRRAVAKLNDLLGYREITLKSDTQPATIAFCKADVTTEDAVK